VAGSIAIGVACSTSGREKITADQSVAVGRSARMRPDYANTVIPPNIAPLNFLVEEPGSRYRVWIHADRGDTIEIDSEAPEITIPVDPWKQLLSENRGTQLHIRIHTRNAEGTWLSFSGVSMTIADEEIDSHIAYRLMRPQYNFYRALGVYQRNLQSYEESLVLHGRSFEHGCVNCHAFRNRDPQQMLIGIRSFRYGNASLLVSGKEVSAIGTAFGHTAWHPSGRVVAFSKYDVRQFFHAARAEVRDVVEFDSLLGYYSFATQSAKTTPAIADKEQLETHPTWSPDGRYLYFVSAPKLWSDKSKFPPERYAEVKYDLKRISYDVQTDQWGQLETVLSAERTGKSILAPRISPDGRFLLVCMCDYGCFAPFRPNSDLYLLDLRTGEYEKLACNSEFSESWHDWSSNGRWIVFSSRRATGQFTRLYFSYIDQMGKAHKPFILPQRDPSFYDSFILLYNVPEFIKGPIQVDERALVDAVRTPHKIRVNAITRATPKADASEPWRGERRQQP